MAAETACRGYSIKIETTFFSKRHKRKEAKKPVIISGDCVLFCVCVVIIPRCEAGDNLANRDAKKFMALIPTSVIL
ncbi:MAG: hypothetical protein J6C05_04685 [Prevotella sp.]|nr:hypothetical protein [Prevotella sp.]